MIHRPPHYSSVMKALLAAVLLWGVYAAVPGSLLANEDSLSVTVTPPLYQLTIGPGDSWASTLKLINSNSYDVTFYAQVADMQASGEEGRSKFTPVLSSPQGSSSNSYLLAQWIRLSGEPIFIKAGSSVDLPFTITIPESAEPGGHYAAILVGTEPDALHATGTMLKVSSLVSSLLFVKIKGNVVESGRIREFLTSRQLYQTPDVDFSLRFENTGNTHIQPQGDIVIYNMWGKERGHVAINQGTDFGNVLPKSIRHFDFSWSGEQDLFDIGLYSAIVGLTYGDEGKQNVSSKTYFWVVPLVPVSIGLGSLLLFIFCLIWFIRRYIRRALMLEHQRLGIQAAPVVQPAASAPKLAVLPAPVQKPSIARALAHPIKEGVIDLRSVAGKHQPSIPSQVGAQSHENPLSILQLMKKYRFFMLFILIVCIAGIGTWLYFSKVLVKSRNFQITDVQIHEEAPATTTKK